MKCVHLGIAMDIEPRAAAIDNSVVRYLRRLGPVTQKALWTQVRSRGLTPEEFHASVERLVELGAVIRETTNHVNSFVLRLAQREKR
jgi:DNA-binding Lrp family transcriptional regulator